MAERIPAPYTAEELAAEEWRPLRGRRQLVSVSSLGRIRNDTTGQVMTPHLTTGAYLRVYARFYSPRQYRIGQSRPPLRSEVEVHRAVAEAFIRPLGEGDQVNHLNGCKLDNRRVNLEVTTCRGNARHAAETGLVRHGEQHPRARLTRETVRMIRERRGESGTALAAEFGVSPSAIYNIWNGLSWVPRPGDPT